MVTTPVQLTPATRRVLRLRLVTDGATYGKGTLDVAVRSVPGPPEAADAAR